MTAEAKRYEVVLEVLSSLAAELKVMELQTIITANTTQLALSPIAIKHSLSHPLRNVFGVFAGTVAIRVIRSQHQTSAPYSPSARRFPIS